jgi:hypothetical protein
MSTARPITPYNRHVNYGLGYLAPRQRRRYIHKVNRNSRIGMLANSDNAKNQPTPKQKRKTA